MCDISHICQKSCPISMDLSIYINITMTFIVSHINLTGGIDMIKKYI